MWNTYSIYMEHICTYSIYVELAVTKMEVPIEHLCICIPYTHTHNLLYLVVMLFLYLTSLLKLVFIQSLYKPLPGMLGL